MKPVYIESTNIISSLGFNTDENFQAVRKEQTGLKQVENIKLSATPFPASLIDESVLADKAKSLSNAKNYTKLEQLMVLSLQDCLAKSTIDIKDDRSLLILSSTKGNINLLDKEQGDKFEKEDINLWKTADKIAKHFALNNQPTVVSNACISGVAACIMGKRLIDAGQYDNVVVVGADILSKFIVSGFQSFMSLSPQPCKPFDAKRDGLSLGEGVASMILTNNKATNVSNIVLKNGAISNDANHISGPSRTGEGLYIAINKTIGENKNIDFISAHGTATPYNDDMESKAISRTGLAHVPVIGTKGYIGHTLGAVGVMEIILGIESMKHNTLIKTLGYNEFGVAEQININSTTQEKKIKTMLKLASGFGGCNAAALFEKHEA